MASMNVKLDTNKVQTLYQAIDSYIDAAAREGNQDTLSGLYDMFKDNDYADEIEPMLESISDHNMNLRNQYKRLFEGKTRSNDASLLSEASFTDTMNDEQKELYRAGIQWVDSNDVIRNSAHKDMMEYLKTLSDNPTDLKKVGRAVGWAITYQQEMER